MTIHLNTPVGSDAPGSSHKLAALVQDQVASRIFAHDATLWGVVAEAEAAVRLGWTDFAEAAEEAIVKANQLRTELLARGIDRVVLCGMGGSSLAPEVICNWAGVQLDIIDSTHPAVVKAALQSDLTRTVVVVSSKSGGTIETLSHRSTFTAAFREAGLDPAEHIVVITDPGSSLEADAKATGQRVFLADPNVGGRFSALTAFGLVPSVLAGADVRPLVAEAQDVRAQLATDSPDNPALRLAVAISGGLPESYVLGVVAEADADWGLGSWIEQLVAESTGKNGKGVLPIALPDNAPELQQTPANTRIVRLSAKPSTVPTREDPATVSEIMVAAPLGAQLVLWETATAVLGRLMGIDPFDQPDVESAKVAAREQLATAVPNSHPENPQGFTAVIESIRADLPPNGYLAIQAYLDPQGASATVLHELRNRLAEVLGVPVALGWGPRYLHSTGQLHKGGPALGVFLQITEHHLEVLQIPGSQIGFETLIHAQASGDRDVLVQRGRPVLMVSCATDPTETVRALLGELVSL